MLLPHFFHFTQKPLCTKWWLANELLVPPSCRPISFALHKISYATTGHQLLCHLLKWATVQQYGNKLHSRSDFCQMWTVGKLAKGTQLLHLLAGNEVVVLTLRFWLATTLYSVKKHAYIFCRIIISSSIHHRCLAPSLEKVEAASWCMLDHRGSMSLVSSTVSSSSCPCTMSDSIGASS